MKQINRGKLFFISLLLFVALIFFIVSLSFEPNARAMPLAVSLAAILMGLPVMINEIYPVRFIRSYSFELVSFSKASKSEKHDEDNLKNLMSIVAWMFGFLIFIFFFGFYTAILFFTLIYLKIQSRIAWPKAVVVSVTLWFFIFLVFGKGMSLSLFKGIFFGEILPPL